MSKLKPVLGISITILFLCVLIVSGCNNKESYKNQAPSEIDWSISFEKIFNPYDDQFLVYKASYKTEDNKTKKQEFILTKKIEKVENDKVLLENSNYLTGPSKGEKDIVLYKITEKGIEKSLAGTIGLNQFYLSLRIYIMVKSGKNILNIINNYLQLPGQTIMKLSE